MRSPEDVHQRRAETRVPIRIVHEQPQSPFQTSPKDHVRKDHISCDRVVILRPIGEAIPTSNSRSEWMEGIHSPPWSAWLRRLRLPAFLQVPRESDAAFSTAFVGFAGYGRLPFLQTAATSIPLDALRRRYRPSDTKLSVCASSSLRNTLSWYRRLASTD